MKVCVIGDIHGTDKFIKCYEKILAEDNDCEKIFVLGDHFDPYYPFDINLMMERFQYFVDVLHKDPRVVSIIGNHDIEGYIIDGCTNRTEEDPKKFDRISNAIKGILPESYIIYRIGNWLFSHAGVSTKWLGYIKDLNPEYPEMVMNNHQGFIDWELQQLCEFYHWDYSMCGEDPYQGPTWIRPEALMSNLPEGYNQAIGHTMFKEIMNLKDKDPNGKIKNDLWVTDNARKPEYLVLNIEESE